MVIFILLVKQQGILISSQFPGPQIDAVTNDNFIISVYNGLREPHSSFLDVRNTWLAFSVTFVGLGQVSSQRHWLEDLALLGRMNGVYSLKTGCVARFLKQEARGLESFSLYSAWNGLQHRRNSWQDGVYGTNSGGFGSIRIWSCPRIPVPFPTPVGDFTVLTGDWFKKNHYILRRVLESAHNLPFPDGLLINGRGWNGYTFTVDPGSHTLQNTYSSLDIHLGQSFSVLVTADQPAQDYYIVVSSRFSLRVLTTTAIPGREFLVPSQVDLPIGLLGPSAGPDPFASGPRPNPQGSYYYGIIKPSRTIMLANSAPYINGKQRYAVNSVSFVPPYTPLKLADRFKIPGVFNLGSIPSSPSWGGAYIQTSVMGANFWEFVKIVFQNWENEVHSWHIDGHSFFVVYPRSWTAIYVALDIRSENWARQYFGQQFYLRVYSSSNSWRDEYPIPRNALLRGRARGRHTRLL
ncbi:hypothetical protein FNV43_RR05616 [Rhamnella rubrinervis]|uniref:Uncharacterized protein n=1 Tax=Rhamnella rubrinervis TaxID=2594499 RepID=A0A8K0MRE2_9ROSA|nr:hypothetical protein FNV43_RR05616 [Rhamnella rubrinervis]